LHSNGSACLPLQSYPVARGANLATDSLVISQTNLPAPRPAVADAWHTALLIAVIVAWSAWGYFGAARMRGAPHAHRVPMYVLTILWEWSVVAYIAWGIHRNGSSLRELIGGRWNSATDFLKDVGIAAGFWILALVVLLCAAVALHTPKGGEAIRFLLPQSRLEIFLWVLLSMTAGIVKRPSFADISRNNSSPGPAMLRQEFCSLRRRLGRGIFIRAGDRRF